MTHFVDNRFKLFWNENLLVALRSNWKQPKWRKTEQPLKSRSQIVVNYSINNHIFRIGLQNNVCFSKTEVLIFLRHKWIKYNFKILNFFQLHQWYQRLRAFYEFFVCQIRLTKILKHLFKSWLNFTSEWSFWKYHARIQ